jgi:hypothetical protein
MPSLVANKSYQDELRDILDEGRCVYVGATGRDPQQRANEHHRERGYVGRLWYARTQNMYRAENKLLDYAAENDIELDNLMASSGAQEEDGYVYVIELCRIRRKMKRYRRSMHSSRRSASNHRRYSRYGVYREFASKRVNCRYGHDGVYRGFAPYQNPVQNHYALPAFPQPIQRWWYEDGMFGSGAWKLMQDEVSRLLNNMMCGQTIRMNVGYETYEFTKTHFDRGSQRNINTNTVRRIGVA